MSTSSHQSLSGTCQCGALRYHLSAPPLFVHVCHCMTCKRHTGSAFWITTIILEEDVEITGGSLRSEDLDELRTNHVCDACGQRIYRTASNHPAAALLNTATLDDSRELSVGAHIWVKRKHPWIVLPAGVPQFDEDYDINDTWPREALDAMMAAN